MASYVSFYQPFKYASKDDGYWGPYKAIDIYFTNLQAANAYIDQQKGDWSETAKWSNFPEGTKMDNSAGKAIWIVREKLVWMECPTPQDLDGLKKINIRQKALAKLSAEEKEALGLGP